MAEFLRNKGGSANTRNFVDPNAPVRRSQAYGYTPPNDPYEINHNLMGGSDLETETFIAEFNYQTQNGKLTGIASYRELNSHQVLTLTELRLLYSISLTILRHKIRQPWN